MADPKNAPAPAAKSTPAPEPKPFISEGVRNDIEMYGETIDPVTGRKLTRADLA